MPVGATGIVMVGEPSFKLIFSFPFVDSKIYLNRGHELKSDLSKQLPEYPRRLLKLVQLLLRDFPALHKLFNLRFGVPLKTLLELLELLYYILKLPHLAGHLPAAESIKQWIRH